MAQWLQTCIYKSCSLALTRYTISPSTDASFALIAFWLWFVVVFAERTELTRFTIFEFVQILDLFVVSVCLYFFI